MGIPTICEKCKKPCTEFINTTLHLPDDASWLAQHRLAEWAIRAVKCQEEANKGETEMKTEEKHEEKR